MDQDGNLWSDRLGISFPRNRHPNLRWEDGLRPWCNIVSVPVCFLQSLNIPLFNSCFITSADNDAWSLTFFFIPMGILLVSGLIFFTISLIKLIILAIKLRKMTSVIIPYSRVLLFVCIFFMVYSFFIAYVINNAANEGEITSGYEAYYECLPQLPGAPPVCSLSDNVSNFPLVILKGFAISCLGGLLFFTFLSWQMVAHWWKILRAIFLVLKERRRQEAVGLFHLVVTDSYLSRSSLSGGGKELSVVADGADGTEGEEGIEGEDSEVSDDDKPAEEESSSSE